MPSAENNDPPRIILRTALVFIVGPSTSSLITANSDLVFVLCRRRSNDDSCVDWGSKILTHDKFGFTRRL